VTKKLLFQTGHGIEFAQLAQTINDMKGIITTTLLLFGLSTFAQIEVEEYERKLSSEVSLVGELAFPQAFSKCGDVTTSVSEQLFSGGCPGNLVQTFTFSDECGNTATAERYISLRDSHPPVFNETPQNVSVTDLSKVPAEPKITASDDSGLKVEVELVEEMKDETLTRTWVATDVCGNESRIQQVISVKSL
jgi:hypothetical protein